MGLVLAAVSAFFFKHQFSILLALNKVMPFRNITSDTAIQAVTHLYNEYPMQHKTETLLRLCMKFCCTDFLLNLTCVYIIEIAQYRRPVWQGQKVRTENVKPA